MPAPQRTAPRKSKLVWDDSDGESDGEGLPAVSRGEAPQQQQRRQEQRQQQRRPPAQLPVSQGQFRYSELDIDADTAARHGAGAGASGRAQPTATRANFVGAGRGDAGRRGSGRSAQQSDKIRAAVRQHRESKALAGRPHEQPQAHSFGLPGMLSSSAGNSGSGSGSGSDAEEEYIRIRNMEAI